MAQHSIRLHPQAGAEVERAYAWYYERNPVAAKAFLDDLESALARITETPKRWPNYQGDMRRYLFRRFPFGVIYRVKDDIIDVVAIAHHHRKPGYWSHRSHH